MRIIKPSKERVISSKKRIPPESIIRDIKHKTRRKFTAEEKIRIVLEGLRREVSIADLCRRECIHTTMFYKWSKPFLEAGKRQLTGDTVREAGSEEVKESRAENEDLKQLVAELSLKNRVLKKLEGFGIRINRYMKYSQSEKIKIIRMVEGSNLSVKKTLEETDVSRSSFYSWYRRYLESGYDCFASRYKRRRQF